MTQPRRRRLLRGALVLSTGLALAATAVTPAGANNGTNNTSKKLRAAVSAEGAMEHLRALQEIADRNEDTRVSGLPGYNESVAYAVDVLKQAGYQVTTQDFTFQTYIERTAPVLERVAPAPAGPVATTGMSYSDSGDVTAPVQRPADAGSASEGCEASDFAGFTPGNIALLQRGACAFGQKATNAEAAGAAGVIIWNNTTGVLNGTLGNTFTGTVPVVAVTQADGQALTGVAGLVMRIKTSTLRGEAKTTNVLAESVSGDPDNVVMAGAHLDSVSAGPGINDNGSGAASILEIAEEMAKVKPNNKVRFGLWAAEESGLVGSNYYVDNLPEAEREKIALYLNFDMVASPNYARFVYDGDNSAFPVGTGAAAGPAGSGQIEQMFHDYFGSVTLPSAETPFSGRSDYGRFIAYGIPSGGLFTGAEGVKTEGQADLFGGVAGASYDPCYHQDCDALEYDFTGDPQNRGPVYDKLDDEFRMAGNVNLDALEEMADAAAHAVLTYAFDTRTVNGKGKGTPVSPPGQATSGKASGEMNDAGGGLHADHDHELADH